MNDKQFTKEDLVVLKEDNHIIVVLKPQNVPSCEDESKDADMLTVIKEHIKERENKAGNVYVGLVHRLDRPTGGVMVFAKSSKAAARLSEQMKTGDFEKRYSAVLVGAPEEKKATLTNYLKKRRKTDFRLPKSSYTRAEVIRYACRWQISVVRFTATCVTAAKRLKRANSRFGRLRSRLLTPLPKKGLNLKSNPPRTKFPGSISTRRPQWKSTTNYNIGEL